MAKILREMYAWYVLLSENKQGFPRHRTSGWTEAISMQELTHEWKLTDVCMRHPNKTHAHTQQLICTKDKWVILQMSEVTI